jgi:hypothetical protein
MEKEIARTTFSGGVAHHVASKLAKKLVALSSPSGVTNFGFVGGAKVR